MFVSEALRIVLDHTAYPCYTGAPASTTDALEQGRYIGRETRQNDKVYISNVYSHLQRGGGEAQAGGAGEHSALDGFTSLPRQASMVEENGVPERPTAFKRRKEALGIGSTPDEHKCFSNAVRLFGQTMKRAGQPGNAACNKFGEDGPNPGNLDNFGFITKISTGDVFWIIHRS
jgi:hypothetical protein